MSDLPLRVTVDTREKENTYSFASYPDVVVESAALPTGDFSLLGFEDRVALERKRLDDLIGCLSQDRARFERELQRAKNYELFAVIIEDSLQNIMAGRYRSQMKSQAVIQSIAAFQVRYRVPFLFCGDRAGGELMTYSLLSKYAYEITKRYDRMTRTLSVCGEVAVLGNSNDVTQDMQLKGGVNGRRMRANRGKSTG